MPLDGSGVASKPAGTTAVPNTTVKSGPWNAVVDDIYNIFNTKVQPVSGGGTGATTAIGAHDAIETKGADISTAATLNLDAATGSFVDLTGPTTVTSVTLGAGKQRMARAIGAFQITVSASLIGNAGGGNVSVEAGDLIIFEGLPSAVQFWVIRKSGKPIVGGDVNSNSPQNLGLVATVASNALTIAIKGVDGNDPSPTNAVYIPFRNATPNSGDVDVLAITAAASLVIPSGATLGTANAAAASLAVVEFNNAGTPVLGIINPRDGQTLTDGIASSSALPGNAAGVFYTAVAVTNKPYTVIGYINITEATAGTWASAPTQVQVTDSTLFNLIGTRRGIVMLPAVTTTSGTAIDLSLAIPPGVKRINVQPMGISLSGGSQILIQMGSGAYETTGYLSGDVNFQTTAGFLISTGTQAAAMLRGSTSLALSDPATNTWVQAGVVYNNAGTPFSASIAGQKDFGGVIDRIRITSANGTDTFDAGKISISYEF